MLTYSCKPHPQFPLFRRLRLTLFIGCFLLGQACIAQNFAYVTNSGSGTVSVIDTTTDTVTATVGVGSRPFGVAANSTRVYVTNSGSNDVSVINTSNNTVVATIPVGLRPLGVAANPQGTRVYVANSGSGSLSIIDAFTNTVKTTVIINGGVSRPFGVAVNPQGNKVYLSDVGNLQIVVIDPATNSVSNELNLDGCPFGIATSSAQEYVAIGCAFGFEIFDPNGSSVISKTSLGDGRFAVAVNPAGTRVYLTDDGNASSNVAVLDAGGNILTKIPTECSEGVSVTPDGKKVYVANCATNSVAVIDANTNTIVNIIPVGSDPEAFGQFITPAQSCQVNITPSWSQGDLRWASNTYDNYNPNALGCVPGDDTTNCRIKKLGCALTTLAMAINFTGSNTIPGTSSTLTPGSLNDFMKRPNTYFTSNHDVDWDPTAHAIKSNLKFQKDFINSQSQNDLDQILCGTHYGKSLPAIVGIHLNNGVPQHFVLVTGKVNGEYQIIDPGDHTNTVLDLNDFVIRGVITDPPDNSAIDLSVGQNAELLVIDVAGHRTGFDSTSGMTVQEIPNSAHFIDSLQDDETGAPAVGTSHFVDVAQPANGPFVVQLSGLQLGEFSLAVHTFGTDGNTQSDEQMLGITSPGTVSTFKINYVSTPGSRSIIIRVATVDSTLKDIDNSLQLGLIDNRGVASSLAKKVIAAQNTTGSARNNILNAFKNEVNAQSGKHINGIAPQVLLEDADSLIGQNTQ